MDFLSLGASWQSTVLLLLAEADGIRPRPHAAVFADTRWEPHDVYEHLDWLETQTTIPIFRVGDRDLYQDTWDGVGSYGQTFTSIPVFALKSTGKMALSRRQCTHNYKIRPIQRRMRELVGRSPRSKYGPSVTQWLGISVDEAHRMKDSGVDWIKNRYPLVEMGMTRSDCRKVVRRPIPWPTAGQEQLRGLPVPLGRRMAEAGAGMSRRHGQDHPARREAAVGGQAPQSQH